MRKTTLVREEELFLIPKTTNDLSHRAGEQITIAGSYSGSTSVLETGGMMHFGVPSVTVITVRSNRLYRRTYSLYASPSFVDGALVELTGVVKASGRFHYPISEICGVVPQTQRSVDLTNEINIGKTVIQNQLRHSTNYAAGVSSLDLCRQSQLADTKAVILEQDTFLSSSPEFYSADLEKQAIGLHCEGPGGRQTQPCWATLLSLHCLRFREARRWKSLFDHRDRPHLA